jgi:hypothetical protein
MNDIPQCCGNCRFYLGNTDKAECRRYPPTPIVVKQAIEGMIGSQADVRFGNPIVSAGYVCGEFQFRQKILEMADAEPTVQGGEQERETVDSPEVCP